MKQAFLFTESLLSGMLPFILLLVCGIRLTLKSRFYQFRNLKKAFVLAAGSVFGRRKTDGISSFEAACTALSATVGTGNIAGVAAALSLGGAGAIFWMWISALVGMCVKAAEISLAVRFREKKNGAYTGGPMYYIRKALPKGLAPLGTLFCAVAIPAVLTSGNLTQTNAAVLSVGRGMGTRLLLGVLFFVFTAAVMRGGSRRVGSVTAGLVPLMAVLYLVLSFGVLFCNAGAVLPALGSIVKGAFCPRAVTGGALGTLSSVMLAGATKGLFSNEAGLGTSAMAHAAAENADPDNQGLYGVFEVFVDTNLLCTLTALTILCSGVKIEYGTVASSELVWTALSTVYGPTAKPLLAVMMCLFGVSSVIGWGFYGTVCSGELFGEAGKRFFMLLYPLVCLPAAFFSASAAWRLSALFNGLMLCINVFAVWMIEESGTVEVLPP